MTERIDSVAVGMVCMVTMPGIAITKPSDVVKALVCATAADHRTVKRWLREPHRVHVGTAHLLETKSAELGLTDRVAAIREASKP